MRANPTLTTSNSHFSSFFILIILIFQHMYPSKQTKIVVKCEIEVRPAPSHDTLPMNSGRRTKLKAVLAFGLVKSPLWTWLSQGLLG